MQRSWIAVFALFCMAAMITGPMITNASGEITEYEPGFVEWKGKQLHRIYLSDSGDDLNLTRDYVGKATGSVPLTGGQTCFDWPTIHASVRKRIQWRL